jgi:hypothetical protein
MQRFAILTFACIYFAFSLAGCGHGSSKTTPNPPVNISVSPAALSLAHGEVVLIPSSSVTVTDSNGATLTTGTVTYSSSNSSIVTVNSAGIVCAGVFDPNSIVCANGPNGTANLTVSANGLSATVAVSVHDRIASVAVVPAGAPVPCTSQNQTQQFTVVACSSGGAPACKGTSADVSSSVGSVNWSIAGDQGVASVDTTGLVTSKLPGAVSVNATVGAASTVTARSAQFVACAPKTISAHVSGAVDTSFSLDPTQTSQLAADLTDVLGQPISGATLTWTSANPASANVSSAGLVTANAAGTTSIVASCTPPSCNPGIGVPIYSNLVTGAVTGSSTTTVYVTGAVNPDGTDNKSLIPIDSTTNTAGTAITLPNPANSMIFNPQGTKAYLGSSAGLMTFDPANPTGTIPVVASVTGKVLAVSNDGVKVAVSDIGAGKLFVYDTSSNTSETFTASGITGGDFSADLFAGLFVSSSNLFVYQRGAGLRSLSGSGSDVKFLRQVSAAMVAGNTLSVRATCNSATVLTPPSGSADVLAVANDGSHVIGATSTNWLDVSPNVADGLCPPTITFPAPSKTPAITASVGTPGQVLITSNAKLAVIASAPNSTSAIPTYNITAGTAGSIPLAQPGQLLSGGLTLDGKSLYVGVQISASQFTVDRIDLSAASPADANQISIGFAPQVVAVQPK